MKRIVLGLAFAAVAAFGPQQASALPEFCGETFQPECDICLEDTWGNRICAPVTFGPPE